ncbi:beta-ketoacyl-ACP synthase II [Chloroflexota bacterium]
MADKPYNRVVVTGIGALCPLGLSMDTTWEGLVAGKSGIDYITLFDTERFETKIAGEVKGFQASDYMNRKGARRMDRFAQLAVAASRQATEQARLRVEPEDEYEIGVIVGTGIGGIITLSEQLRVLFEKGPENINPFLIPMMIADMASAQVSMALGTKGPNFCTTSACSSGADAIGIGYETVKWGGTKAMIVGGSEAIVTPIGVAGFNACKALSTRNDIPQLASRPFDAGRDGFVIGEGACILVLENLAYAQERGTKILAEVVGYGASSDAHHITQPDEAGRGAIRAMQMALRKAGIDYSEVNYINAHGTSTPLNDKVETLAIKAVFGDQAYTIPISATKSMTGHLIGSAGSLGAAACIMAIQTGMIHPTINLTNPDPECDLDYVPGTARQANITTAMSNSFGFGGHNSALVFRKYSEA